MAGKVSFRLEDLREVAVQAAVDRIQNKKAYIETLENDPAHEQALAEWRQRCITAIEELHDYRYGVSDEALSEWRLPPMPKPDEHLIVRAKRDLAVLHVEHDRIAAKSQSLAPDEDGNVHLTRAQMSEFFGL